MQERGPTLTAGRLFGVIAGTALLVLALIVGAATAAKKNKVVEVANSATLQGQPNSDGPFQESTVTSQCPKGKVAFGGWIAEVGFGDGPGVATFGLERTSKRQWSATAANAAQATGDLTSLGNCSKKVKKLTPVSATTTLGTISEPSGQGSVSATCPKKKSVRAGGFTGQFDALDADPAIQAIAMVRPSKRTLEVRGVNAGETTGGTLEAIAYCGKGPKLKQVAGTTPVPPLADLDATATCPKRKPLAFGGFEAELDVNDFSPFVVPHAMRRSTKRGWSATGLNFSGLGEGPPIAGNLTAYAYCGKKR